MHLCLVPVPSRSPLNGVLVVPRLRPLNGPAPRALAREGRVVAASEPACLGELMELVAMRPATPSPPFGGAQLGPSAATSRYGDSGGRSRARWCRRGERTCCTPFLGASAKAARHMPAPFPAIACGWSPRLDFLPLTCGTFGGAAPWAENPGAAGVQRTMCSESSRSLAARR